MDQSYNMYVIFGWLNLRCFSVMWHRDENPKYHNVDQMLLRLLCWVGAIKYWPQGLVYMSFYFSEVLYITRITCAGDPKGIFDLLYLTLYFFQHKNYNMMKKNLFKYYANFEIFYVRLHFFHHYKGIFYMSHYFWTHVTPVIVFPMLWLWRMHEKIFSLKWMTNFQYLWKFNCNYLRF